MVSKRNERKESKCLFINKNGVAIMTVLEGKKIVKKKETVKENGGYAFEKLPF
jgi:hypothetical protein